MKKILCLFSALSIVLMSSCSSDDSPSGSDSVLLKKVILTGTDGKLTTNFTYNGNKIVSAIDDSGDVGLYYTYTGDLITKIEFKYPNGTIDQINTFTYNADGKLATFLRVEPNLDWGHKEVYTYNADGTITSHTYTGNSKTQTSDNGTATIKFLNNEISEIIAITANQPDRKYTYDSKNNPAKNVLGLDKIAFADGEGTGVFHNELSETTDGKISATYNYTYNSAEYPEKSSDKIDGFSYTSEYFY